MRKFVHFGLDVGGTVVVFVALERSQASRRKTLVIVQEVQRITADVEQGEIRLRRLHEQQTAIRIVDEVFVVLMRDVCRRGEYGQLTAKVLDEKKTDSFVRVCKAAKIVVLAIVDVHEKIILVRKGSTCRCENRTAAMLTFSKKFGQMLQEDVSNPERLHGGIEMRLLASLVRSLSLRSLLFARCSQ